MKETLTTGIRPTGELHLGNYYGAMKNLITLQETYNAFYFIVDIHSLTTHSKPESLQQNIFEIAKDYLAAGLKPERCTFYTQSSIAAEVCELNSYLSMVTPLGELLRCPTFKENAVRIPSLNGQGKMSKSDDADSYISLKNDNEQIKTKVRKAFSDPTRLYKHLPGHPTVDECNVYHLHTYFTDGDVLEGLSQQCREASIGCVNCKAALSESLIALVEPFRERRNKISDDMVADVLRYGGEKARESAQRKIADVRRAIGLQMF